jgi:peroxiredoxin
MALNVSKTQENFAAEPAQPMTDVACLIGEGDRCGPDDRLHGASRRPGWLFDAVKTRQRAIPPVRADGLADVVIPDDQGRAVRLGDLWRDQPATIVWLRQFGCPFCRAYAVQLNRARSQFDECGSALVLIGQGSPDDAASFRARFAIDLTVLADASRATYLTAGTKLATLGELLAPAVLTRALIAMAHERVFLGRNTADEAQLGGTIIVTADGQIPWAHLSENASDMATPETILTALKGLARTSHA